jgi:SET domain-containing protein
MENMYENFEVKKSQIPGAGKGLYTKVDFKKGERIIEYLGEIITEAELDKRAENDIFGYAFYISKRKCIDAYYMPEALARYANDAKGLTRVKGLKNNCCYAIWKNRGWIETERNIKAGEEILVSYGGEYWRDIRYNIKIEEEKKEAKRKEKTSKAKSSSTTSKKKTSKKKR